MDCIKGAIELGSECYPCVCEVIDALWPDDAPNCFKKEIKHIREGMRAMGEMEAGEACNLGIYATYTIL